MRARTTIHRSCSLRPRDRTQPRAAAAHPLLNLQRTVGNQAILGVVHRHRASAESDRPDVSPRTESQIEGLNGGGEPLAESVREYFEPRFGRDFSGVRVHAGSGAAEAALQLNAKAFTVGNDVAFGAGQYAPNTADGRRLLAHELTHVIQQGAAFPHLIGRPTIQRQPGTGYGLATPASRSKYVAEAVNLWKTKKSMNLTDFADALMKVIEADVKSHGVPELKWSFQRGTGTSGSFDNKPWLVTIDPDAFSDHPVSTLADLTLEEVTDVAGTLYHESRHTEQDVLIVRVLLDQKKAVKDIVKETGTPERIVNAIQKTKYAAPPDKDQVAHASRMFEVMYGKHRELLTFLLHNSPAVAGIQALANAQDAAALQAASPHVATVRDFATNVLDGKVKALKATKKPSAQEIQLTRDLDALNQATVSLLAAFDAAARMSKPSSAALQAVQKRTEQWQTKLMAAYQNLEGEKDAFAVEALVKKEFSAAARAKPKPAPKK